MSAHASSSWRLSCERYAVLHALLASLPHAAVVTTNSDLCYDAACAAAGVSLNVLPYDTRPSERWLLKLHGDVHHPEDIVLTYSSGAPYGADREALSGLVQALLITKHMLFVGFSLRDTSFNQVATTVRRALGAADDAEEEPSAAPQAFGSAITLSERPFLAELWPDLESIPVSAGVAADEADLVATVRWGFEWDIAAAGMIAREAGSAVSDAYGKKLDYNKRDPRAFGVLVSAPDIHGAAVERLAKRLG